MVVVRGEMRHASGIGVLEASPDFRNSIGRYSLAHHKCHYGIVNHDC